MAISCKPLPPLKTITGDSSIIISFPEILIEDCSEIVLVTKSICN